MSRPPLDAKDAISLVSSNTAYSTWLPSGIVAVIAGIAAGFQYQLFDARACRIAQLAEPTNHNIHNPP